MTVFAPGTQREQHLRTAQASASELGELPSRCTHNLPLVARGEVDSKTAPWGAVACLKALSLS